MVKKTQKGNSKSKKTPGAPDPASVKREKQKAKDMRQSVWWQSKLNVGLCHYCGKKFEREELTMDHIVPLARGGKSSRGNIVPACQPCNSDKKYYTPAELILKKQMKSDVTF